MSKPFQTPDHNEIKILKRALYVVVYNVYLLSFSCITESRITSRRTCKIKTMHQKVASYSLRAFGSFECFFGESTQIMRISIQYFCM